MILTSISELNGIFPNRYFTQTNTTTPCQRPVKKACIYFNYLLIKLNDVHLYIFNSKKTYLKNPRYPQNCHIYFKNVAVLAARSLRYVYLFCGQQALYGLPFPSWSWKINLILFSHFLVYCKIIVITNARVSVLITLQAWGLQLY